MPTPASAAAALSGVETRSAPLLVGRSRPLATLRALWAQACAGQGALVLVEGDAGIGKSRLLRALTEQARADKPAGDRWVSHCFEADQGVPYAAVADLLRTLWNSLDHAAQRERFGRYARETAPVLPELAALVPGGASDPVA